jgi:hypothetical protein
MSYADLDDHPRRHELMGTAFTLNTADRMGDEIGKARREQRAKVKA